MSLKASQWKNLVSYAKTKYKGFDEHHDLEYVKRTVALAKYLAKKEHANVDVCKAGAWLQGIGRSKSKKDYPKESARIAQRYLKKIGTPQGFANKVVECIRLHQDIKALIRTNSIEAKVVHDADQLQVTGPFGFLRKFSMTHKHGNKSIKHSYMHAKKESQSAYESKLLTASARRLIKKEYLFLLRFYDVVERWERINNILKQ